MIAPSSRLARLSFLLLILAAFALRVLRLDAQSLWYDEGVTAAIAQRGLSELTRWTANDIQPPLYYYMMAGWGALAGWSEWALRFPSVFFGLLLIPLLALVAWRLTALRAAAWMAALLAAFHPLLVYYSQEARMYALLLALAVLAAYLLLRLASPPRPARLLWLSYIGVATAAAYTHYFAFFLLLALGCAWLLDRPTRAQVGRFLAASLAILVLYLPWMAVLLTQLRVDRSYWTGTLKLQEALLAIARSFTSGASMAERTATWLLLPYLAVTLLALYALWRSRAQSRRLLRYAGFWLLIPILAVLVLAFNVPKFNARYVMLALPGLLLLWSGGLAALAGPHRAPSMGQPQRRLWQERRRLYFALGTALLLTGFLWANLNWFLNPAFAKDQWRELAAFLRSRAAPDEQIVLVSGHAWAVWDYYAPDLPALRLPDLPILDVDAVLDFAATGPPLAAAFAVPSGKTGAWLVNWQEEVVDPNDVVPVQLELGGREKGQNATFSGLTLRRFGGIRPTRFALAPPVDHLLDIPFGDQVTLHGYKVLNNGDLLLFWRRDLPPHGEGADLHVALQTRSLAGRPLAQPQDRRLAGYNYPSFRWPAGSIVMGHLTAAEWLGDEPQPGQVALTLRVYDGQDPSAAPLPVGQNEVELRIEPVEIVID